MDNEKIDLEKKQVIAVWESFVKKKEGVNLNSDKEKINLLAKGVINNQKKFGVKYCPCRLRTKDFEKDLKLVCPCNFLIQKTWKENGECWCSLFVKESI